MLYMSVEDPCYFLQRSFLEYLSLETDHRSDATKKITLTLTPIIHCHRLANDLWHFNYARRFNETGRVIFNPFYDCHGIYTSPVLDIHR